MIIVTHAMDGCRIGAGFCVLLELVVIHNSALLKPTKAA